MAIQFHCPSCAKKMQAPDNLVGQKARCPNCTSVVLVPGSETPSSPVIVPKSVPIVPPSAVPLPLPPKTAPAPPKSAPIPPPRKNFGIGGSPTVPEEPPPLPKKSAREEAEEWVDEEPPPRRSRREEVEEETPRSRRFRREEEDFDDRPRRRRPRRGDYDDDFDTPRTRKERAAENARTMGIISLTLGVISLCLSLFCGCNPFTFGLGWLTGIPLAIVGLILGIIAHQGREKSTAMSGIVLNIVAMAIPLFLVILGFAGMLASTARRGF